MSTQETQTPAGLAQGTAPSRPAPGGHFRALGKNVLLKYASESSRLFQLAFFVIVARRFGASDLGNLTFLLMAGSLVALFVGDLGINTTAIARMNAHRGAKLESIASEALFWKNAFSLAAIVLICGVLYATGSSRSWLMIGAVAVISLGSIWLEFLCALTNGVNRLEAEVWIRIAYRGAVYGGGALAALFASLRSDLVFMAAAVIVTLAGAFQLLRRRMLPVKVIFRPQKEVGLLKESLPVWVTQLAQLSYLRFDIVILGLLHVTASEIGWYAAAWKIVDVLSGVPALLSAAALPLISGATGGASVSGIAPRYLKLMYVLPFLFALPLAIGADWVTRLLYGAGFAGTPRVLQILVWALVPVYAHTFLAIVAVATRRQADAAKLATAASILSVLAAVILVPKLGYEAMAAVSLAANALFACAMVCKFRDATESMQVGTGIKSLLSAAGTFWVCTYFLPDTHPVLLMAGGTAGYCAALVLLRVVNLRHLGRGWRFLASLVWGREVGGVSAA